MIPEKLSNKENSKTNIYTSHWEGKKKRSPEKIGSMGRKWKVDGDKKKRKGGNRDLERKGMVMIREGQRQKARKLIY